MSEFLYGRNAVRECLRGRRRHIHRLLLADSVDSAPILEEIVALAGELNIPVQTLARARLDKRARGHQGVALQVGRYPTVAIADILLRAEKANEPPFILGLDHLEDPHNLGAVMRTADAVGVHGLIIPHRRAAGVTPAAVSASAGAAEHVWVAEVANMAQTLQKLKKKGLWLVGVEDTAKALPYHQADLSGPIGLVIGSEGQGLSRLVRERCDFLIKLPMRGQVESLNASVACALALYEVWRARQFV